MCRDKMLFVQRFLVGVIATIGVTCVAVDCAFGIDAAAVEQKNMGVGFSYLGSGGHTLSVTLTAQKQDQKITYSTWSAPSGLYLWNPDENRTGAVSHTYQATGVLSNASYGVLFSGILSPVVGGRPADPSLIRFRDSLADLTVAIDSGIPPRHVAINPNDPHWTPDLDDTVAHDNNGGDSTGGMGIPPSLHSGDGFPQTTDGTAYKIALLRLRTNWAGHFEGAAPQHIGALLFQFSARGVAIYGDGLNGPISYDSSAQDRTIDITPNQGSRDTAFRILTNDRFTTACTITVTYSWDSSIQGGPYTVQDKFRLFPQQEWEYNQGLPAMGGLKFTKLIPLDVQGDRYVSPKDRAIARS